MTPRKPRLLVMQNSGAYKAVQSSAFHEDLSPQPPYLDGGRLRGNNMVTFNSKTLLVFCNTHQEVSRFLTGTFPRATEAGTFITRGCLGNLHAGFVP